MKRINLFFIAVLSYLSTAMTYTFKGGPLDGQTRKLHDTDLKDGKYIHIEWGEYSDPLNILPSLAIHQYLPVDDEMLWIVPEVIVK